MNFVDALWSIINPLRQLTILNATAYDVLVLLIYRVSNSISQYQDTFSDYLFQLYTSQLYIDLDKYGTDSEIDSHAVQISTYLQYHN